MLWNAEAAAAGSAERGALLFVWGRAWQGPAVRSFSEGAQVVAGLLLFWPPLPRPAGGSDCSRACGRCSEQGHPLHQKAGGHHGGKTKQEESGGGARRGGGRVCGGERPRPPSGEGQSGAPAEVEGSSDEENTWEPEGNLDCPDLVAEFLQPQKTAHETDKSEGGKRKADSDSEFKGEESKPKKEKEESEKPRGFARGLEPELRTPAENSCS